MTDYSQQRRSPRRHLSTRAEDEVWLDQQDIDTSIEDEQWPPRTHTRAVRYQPTTYAVPCRTAMVRTIYSNQQRMRGVSIHRSALPSHFLAINLNCHILVIELPAGDATKARIYSDPVLLGPSQDRTPVTLSFQVVNGDGKPDLLVWVADTYIVFHNDGSGFRPARPGVAVAVSA